MVLDEPIHIKTFMYVDRSDRYTDRQLGDIFRVGFFTVTNASELENNPACEEKVEYSRYGSSGYYSCDLFGNVITMERPPYPVPSQTPPLQIMELKAWSQSHLNHKGILTSFRASSGTTNFRGYTAKTLLNKRPIPFNFNLRPWVAGLWTHFRV